MPGAANIQPSQQQVVETQRHLVPDRMHDLDAEHVHVGVDTLQQLRLPGCMTRDLGPACPIAGRQSRLRLGRSRSSGDCR
jgi:hypothetical protein